MAWNKYFTVEVPLLLLSFGMELSGSVFQNFFLYRTCYTLVGYPEADCSQLGNVDNNLTEFLEGEVQPTANKINMVQNTVSNILTIFFCMYVGAWADQYGRKPFLLMTMIATNLNTVGNLLIIHFKNATPWWFLVSSLPSLITGGFATHFIIVSAYLIDVTTKKDRVIRFATLEVITMTTGLIGRLFGMKILQATSYETIYMIVVGIQLLGIFYTIFFIPESLKEKKPAQATKMSVFAVFNFKKILKAALKKRENNINRCMFLLIFIELLGCFAMGEMNNFSLYLRHAFYWTASKINTVTSISTVCKMIGTTLGTFILYKVLKIKEAHLALMGIIILMIINLLQAIATSDMYFYICFGLSSLSGLTMLMWKTIMSYIIRPEEMGNILALKSILLNLVSLVSGIVYPAIYNATLHTYPGVYNYLSLGIHVVVAILTYILSRMTIPHYTPTTNELPVAEENSETIPQVSVVSDVALDLQNEENQEQLGSISDVCVVGDINTDLPN